MRIAFVVALAGCDQILSIPTTIEDACESDVVCPVEEPRCDIESGTCVECTQDSHCPSGMCRPSGACVLEEEVLFTTAGSTRTACTRADPCDLPLALSLASETQNVIGLDAVATYLAPATIVVTGSLTIRSSERNPNAFIALDARATSPLFHVMPGSELAFIRVNTADGPGRGIDCTSAKVTISGLFMSNFDSAVNAVDCDLTLLDTEILSSAGVGVAAEGGSLRIRRSNLRGNIAGAVVASDATIESSYFRNNGLFNSDVSSVRLERGRIESSTFFGNSAGNQFGHTILCGAGVVIDSCIAFANAGLDDFAGECEITYTNSTMLQPGTGNLSVDPVIAGDQLHLEPQSPCAGAGNPALRRTFDIDREPRPQPEDTAPDCGADEIP